jgi:hypothetical protein
MLLQSCQQVRADVADPVAELAGGPRLCLPWHAAPGAQHDSVSTCRVFGPIPWPFERGSSRFSLL